MTGIEDASQMYCWGNDYVGSLGDGVTKTFSNVPVAVNMSGVLAGKTIKDFSMGAGHTCVIASDNKPYCWGFGRYGQLGDNTSDLSSYSSSLPVAVDMSGDLSGLTIKKISSGSMHTCVVASDDQVYCWGDNGYSQMGNKSPSNTFAAPTSIISDNQLAGKKVVNISSSISHTCVITNDGGYYCWGISNKAV